MSRDPSSIPVTLVVDEQGLDKLATALSGAVNVAIDTETPIDGPRAGRLRVASIATRDRDGRELAFVVDGRDLDPQRLAPLFDGVTADAWNANFDARVIDDAVYASDDVTRGLRWWDAQLADALIHQGRSGFSWYHGLAWATEHYLGIQAEGKGSTQLSYTATDDLTSDQISYAAADAVETLWVADALRREIDAAGLTMICEIEMAARPFLDRMERTGLPFDWPGWKAELETMESQHRDVVGRIALITGGGQGSLFDDVTEPNWNPASDKQVRQALNRWSEPEVAAWTHRRYGTARRLSDQDSVSAGVLREIGGTLAEALLEFRNYAKILSTYGESMHDHVHGDGRMRPQYLQVVGTNTGRLASRNPNAQNFTPRMKPHVRPGANRVFVHADLSQAELRFLAQVAEDAPLKAAFARGEDVHVATAASMFGFDADELAASDPGRFKQLRQMAKALNFGIAYGTGAEALARSLTANGTPTSLDEGRKLLAQYRRTYPGTTAWAQGRISEIESISRTTNRIEWAPTLRLARSFAEISSIRRAFRQSQRRWPNAEEVAAVQHPDARAIGPSTIDHVAWVMQFSAPVALVDDNEPFTFASRTVAGRRQQFNLHVDRLFLLAACEAIEASDSTLVSVRSRFEAEHGLVLWDRASPPSRKELGRQFEDRSLRRRYIEAIAAEAGDDVANAFLNRAARERVRAMVNAWRNAPIQGGVADIMLDAYARLHGSLWDLPSARPVQTVHDSVVVECDRAEAPAVARAVRHALEQASLRFCPDVRPAADVDIRTSLADADVVTTTDGFEARQKGQRRG
jgi:DNA polymerase I-like protein with 3'-5' exonuclease and polymerase domains